tara:strand:+ start:182 stop:484 length:303 start_codon:yes stop_codon:yes gene_type:complete
MYSRTDVAVISKTNKSEVELKLNRILGRIKGLMKMVEEDRDCTDILMQLSATYESLRVVSKYMIKEYLETKVSAGLTSINTQKKDEAYEDVLDTIYKYVK